MSEGPAGSVEVGPVLLWERHSPSAQSSQCVWRVKLANLGRNNKETPLFGKMYEIAQSEI